MQNKQNQQILSKSLKIQKFQDLQTINPSSSQIISRQATLNIGTIGHVAHGKSTIVRTITGINPIKTKLQLVKNITIKLGYANAKIYKCTFCKEPQCYKSSGSSTQDIIICQICKNQCNLIKHVSFVDCPGHDALISTMLTGAAIMDAALLLIGANMKCPQPQTVEHLSAIQQLKLQNIIILQNKIDLVLNQDGRAQQNYNEIKSFIKNTICSKSEIIPVSAINSFNIDCVLQSISKIPVPTRNLSVSPKLIIVRSFDINKPGTNFDKLVGGVIGGSITQGILKVGMNIQIKPGIVLRNSLGKYYSIPIKSRIISLQAENNELLYAIPGGLIGVRLLVDPNLTKGDKLIGNILGEEGRLPPTVASINVQYKVLQRLLCKQKNTKIEKLKVGQILKFNIESNQTPGSIINLHQNIMEIELQRPICTEVGQKIVFSRKIQGKFRLIGLGTIKNTKDE